MPDTELRRCPTGAAGRYKVSLRVAHATDEQAVQIGSHQPVFRLGPDGRATFDKDGVAIVEEQAPVVTTKQPYEGPLCEHELQFLNGVPGKDYRAEYEFTVERLKTR